MRWRRRWTAVALAGVAALAMAGCGGGSSGPAVATAGGDASASPRAALDPQDAQLAFARCMREHGVDLPDPSDEGPGLVRVGEDVSPQTFRKADEACRQYLPDLGAGPGKLDQAAQDRALAFAKCMRANGVDMPDPDFSGSGGGVQLRVGGKGDGEPDIDPTDPTFRAAEKACRGELGGAVFEHRPAP